MDLRQSGWYPTSHNSCNQELTANSVFQCFRRIIKDNPGWKKCGYETPLALKNRTEYKVEVFGAVEALELNLNCSIFSSAQFPTINVHGHDFIELAISTENQVTIEAVAFNAF